MDANKASELGFQFDCSYLFSRIIFPAIFSLISFKDDNEMKTFNCHTRKRSTLQLNGLFLALDVSLESTGVCEWGLPLGDCGCQPLIAEVSHKVIKHTILNQDYSHAEYNTPIQV